ncbi:cytochrome P450 [Nocardia pseudovaccinii]|uniref:cytochrome P450 n=1 Tax=Nocardia pseudovaccinii TaxID=189540 RepID=UPI003D8FC1FE
MKNPIESIPLAPNTVPILGHGIRFLTDPIGFLSSLPTHGRLSRVQLGPLPVVVVCDPELARVVLLDDRTFDRGGPLYDRSREVAGDGIGTCPHSRHRRQRRLSQPAFQPGRMPGYSEAMVDSIEDVIGSWQEGQQIQLGAEMSKLTVRVAVRTMFSSSFPETSVQQVADDFTTIAGSIFRRMVLPPAVNRLPTPANRRYYQARNRLRAVAAELIDQRRADNRDHGDLLSSLMRARDPDSTGAQVAMSDEELIDQVFTFLFAGAETTASTLTWALYLLGRNPELRRQVQHEVDTVLSDSTARYQDLANLPVVNRVVTETLRLYPAGWLLTRVVSADTILDGVPLPAGTTVAVSPHVIHRRDEIYDRAGEFVPDRWIGAEPDRTLFISFGAGARRCIGDQFGLVEASLALATIAARWRVDPLSTRPVPVSLAHLPAPTKLGMRVWRRDPVTVDASASEPGR